MHKLYLTSIGLGLTVSAAITAGYFFATQTDNLKDQTQTNTQYSYVSVDSPIQPIPTIAEIDLEWFYLGKALFNSPLLSSDNTISCASCHLTEYGGDDGFPVSTGVNSKTGTRNSPTVLNAVFNFQQFWDGRSHSLADQISGPIHNPVEMNSNWSEIIEKLKQDEAFQSMFDQVSQSGISKEAIIKAITTFEEALITPNSPIDRYLLGDTEALTAQQKRGYQKFLDYGCIACHQGLNIGGNLFQKLGRIDIMPAAFASDFGLYEVTGNEEDKHVFKVPSLRNVAETAPYFHDGSVETLEEAVTIMAQVQLGRSLSEEDKADLIALLKSFSSPYIEYN